MRKIFILILFSLAELLSAQDYLNICSPGITFFANKDKSVKAFRQDSIYFPGNNDTLFLSYRSIRDTSSSMCKDTTQGSFLGRKVYKKHDGWFCFFNKQNDTVKINTQAGLNATWTFCNLTQGEYIQAKVSSVITDSVLGTTDQVKVISFQAKAGTYDIPHPLNQCTIHLSQHYGLAKMLDVYFIPGDTVMYYLQGKSDPPMGLQDMSWVNVFNFDTGEIFHYRRYFSPEWATIYSIKTVLSKQVIGNSDTIIYTFQNCYKVEGPNPAYGLDTITEKYYASVEHDYTDIRMPEEFSPYRGWHYTASYYFANTASFNSRFTKGYSPKYEIVVPSQHCWGYAQGQHSETYQYTRGLGRTYYQIWDMDQGNIYDDEQNLVYFKNGNETWGSPLSTDCNTLVGTGRVIDAVKRNISICPNPVEIRAEIILTGYDVDGNTLSLYNSSGNMIFLKMITSNHCILDMSSYPGGLYLLAIIDKNGMVAATERFIRK